MHPVLRRLCALVVAGVLTGFTFLLLTGDYINEGPVLASVSKDHGIHSGDLWVLAGWAVAMITLVALTATPARPCSRGTPRISVPHPPAPEAGSWVR